MGNFLEPISLGKPGNISPPVGHVFVYHTIDGRMHIKKSDGSILDTIYTNGTDARIPVFSGGGEILDDSPISISGGNVIINPSIDLSLSDGGMLLLDDGSVNSASRIQWNNDNYFIFDDSGSAILEAHGGNGFYISTTTAAYTFSSGGTIEFNTNSPAKIVIALSTNSTTGNLSHEALTGARSWNLPDNSGTIALLSDINSSQTLEDTLGFGNIMGTGQWIEGFGNPNAYFWFDDGTYAELTVDGSRVFLNSTNALLQNSSGAIGVTDTVLAAPAQNIIRTTGDHDLVGVDFNLDFVNVVLSNETPSKMLKLDASSNIKSCSFDEADVLTATSTHTVTNKRISDRNVSVVVSATPAINTDNGDVFLLSGLNVAVTSFTTNLTGTPTPNQKWELHILDDGTNRALTFGSSFANGGVLSLPTSTAANVLLRLLFEWNAVTSKHELIGWS